MNDNKETNQSENESTVLSIVATGPFCAMIGYIIGKSWGDWLGGLLGLAVGYAFGVFFHNWIFDKKGESQG